MESKKVTTNKETEANYHEDKVCFRHGVYQAQQSNKKTNKNPTFINTLIQSVKDWLYK
ncbi:hypothetical protein KCM76_06140 [Zooshikella marina]|uniref:hypothetical protein n=1 Tax=Zooshikella ganghwensis TaxID=202772 RepID=UPI001BAF53D6|nr:hypothetical protein [Zooshikella ganghwensis]MBU2705551.1 hypothetical protein [Zooshikella ganghwensis]